MSICLSSDRSCHRRRDHDRVLIVLGFHVVAWSAVGIELIRSADLGRVGFRTGVFDRADNLQRRLAETGHRPNSPNPAVAIVSSL